MVSKYDIRWQFFRNKLKGKTEEEKRMLIFSFQEYLTIENKERLTNYIRGCFYDKSIEAFYLSWIRDSTTIIQINEDSIENYSIKEKVSLYRDLFQRNKNWLKKGYFHKDQNDFLDTLSLFIPPQYLKTEELILLRTKCNTMKNTWKFIY